MRAYPRYRDSGVEWLGEVPEHWDVRPLNRSVSRSDVKIEADDADGLPYVGLEHVASWTGSLLPLDEQQSPESISNAFTSSDVLFGKLRPYLAKAFIAEFDGLCSTEFLVLRPIAYDRRYLLHAMLTDGFVSLVDSSTYGAKMPRANWDFVGNTPLPLPPLDEQRAIAAFLDRETERVDALVTKKRLLIERLDEYRASLITRTVTRGLPPEAARAAGLDPSPRLKPSGVEWLGEVPEHWEVKEIKWETPVLRGASPRPIDDEAYFNEDGSHGWVRIADVTAAGMYLERTTQRLSKLGISLSVPLSPGELFLSIAGSVGKPCITNIPCCIHDGFVYFPRWRGDTRFLYYVFASGEPYRGLGKLGTQLNLNTDTVGAIHIGVPPIPEQAAIADYLVVRLGELDSTTAKVDTAIERLQEHRTALITAAVTGKIDVRESATGAPGLGGSPP